MIKDCTPYYNLNMPGLIDLFRSIESYLNKMKHVIFETLYYDKYSNDST